MRNNSELFRSVITSPFAATDNNGEVVNLEELLFSLKEEIILITDLAEMNITLENKYLIEEFLDERKVQGLSVLNNAEIARQLNITFPKEFHCPGKSGRSRVNKIDVGIVNCATVVVYDTEENRIAHSTTLSQRVHSLANKVKRANTQVASLRR